jgi:ABC-type multidrug transport system fused ATPase/permease subunit
MMAQTNLGRRTLLPRAYRDYALRYYQYRWELAFAVTLSVAQSLSLIPVAWFIKLAFDRILEKSNYPDLFLPCLAILFLVGGSSALSLLSRHHSLRITKLVIQDMRVELFAKSYEVAATFSNTADRSSLHTTIVQDTERVDVGSNAIVVLCIPALVTAAIFFVALAATASTLLFATAITAPLALVTNRILGRQLRTLAEKFREALKNFDEHVFAALRRIELARLRGAEQIEIEYQTAVIDGLRRASGRMAWFGAAYSTAQTCAASVASVVTLIAGGGAVSGGWMSVSELAAYYFILSRLGASLSVLWAAAPQVIAGLVSLENIGRMQLAPRRTPADGTHGHEIRGTIEFRNVCFSYGDVAVLKGVNLMIPAGARVAIVGPNGGGKTTIAHLLLGIYRPNAGEIFVDGVPLADLTIADYRRQIGVALQDQMIFAGTVRQNIAYGFPEAPFAEIERAARRACADRFIRSLPHGYDTLIGQAGVALSGGQSQMLTLARAFLGAPQVLILDEPTNHLDEATAKAVFSELSSLVSEPTIIVISHDLELFESMDCVYQLVDGRLSLLRERPSGGGIQFRTMRASDNA